MFSQNVVSSIPIPSSSNISAMSDHSGIMEDNLSIKSSDSVTTSGEYEIVPEAPEDNKPTKSPTLNIANNGDFTELEKNLHEVIHELDQAAAAVPEVSDNSNVTTTAATNTIDSSQGLLNPNTVLSAEMNKVGQSVFYDCIDLSPTAEKHDNMKPERSDTEEEMSDIDQDCTIFAGIIYLGAATINAPKSEVEIQRNMSELNSCTDPNNPGIKVSVSIPSCSEGFVVLHDQISNTVIAHYEIQRILFYARGTLNTVDQACFAFTWSHGESLESAIFQCHVFKCSIPEAVSQVSACFAKAFQRVPQSLTGSMSSTVDSNAIMMTSITADVTGNPLTSAEYEFIVSLEIREKMTKNAFTSAPRDRSSFRLRCNTDKQVSITVKQTQSNKLPALFIERCFGVLLSPGKLVRQADMRLLDMVSMGYVKIDPPQTQTIANTCLQPYVIRAEWKANDKNFEKLNYESQKMYLTVAVDLVIKGIQEPVRFVIETPVSIQAQNEIRLMDHFFAGKKTMLTRFYLQLKDNGENGWEVNSIDPSEEIIEPTSGQGSILKNLGINHFSRMVRSTSNVSIDDDTPTDYSSDGDEPLLSGTGEVSKDCSQDTLDEWGPIIQEWDGDKRPKNLPQLVRLGVPEALRGKIWQKLSNVENKVEMTERYRVLLTKETKCETVIQRDINRTFPAHKFFRETGGSGQESLFKVSKAYAVYDSELGYTQGLSFIAATLLLHMPEEEAFCVLIALMYDYRLRDLYKGGFENLSLKLYQLDRLMKDQLPKLHEHFVKTGVEAHMFASQWFLTIFTALLLDGINFLFQVALTLLSVCEAELRQLDFEGILKYFRITLPKKCRSSGQTKKLLKIACEKKVKKLKVYEEEFVANKELIEKQEQEIKQSELKFVEERNKMKAEAAMLRSQLDQAIEKNKIDEKKNSGIITDYKQIIQRQEDQITKLNTMLEDMTRTISKCLTCSSNISSDSPLHKQHLIGSNNHTNEDAPLGPLDPLNTALQRVRELELELAQTKLAHVEAECKNQDLNHQLNTTLTEIQTNRGSWQPWLSKTINSIQEKVSTRRDTPTFQSYANDGSVVHAQSESPKRKPPLSHTQNARLTLTF
ncbi:Rab GTPase-activating protein 1 [Pseudolycoriella hygida]|uniref:Rab GTPase-activating protein 1 n=1 Tax=Pseudolycoriella hygida TaxID=35572 RepID=A0A9Q0N2P8_9DIPT|nr:Rab GTPase-activating protein 1 [Pseudolycoriella hygida]